MLTRINDFFIRYSLLLILLSLHFPKLTAEFFYLIDLLLADLLKILFLLSFFFEHLLHLCLLIPEEGYFSF